MRSDIHFFILPFNNKSSWYIGNNKASAALYKTEEGLVLLNINAFLFLFQ